MVIGENIKSVSETLMRSDCIKLS